MLSVVVHALWGVRAEDPGRLAERWVGLLDGLAKIGSGGCTTWRGAESEDDLSAAPVERVASGVRAYVERTNTEPDAPYIGYTSFLWSGRLETVKVTVAINAGGSANRVSDSCVVELESTAAPGSVELINRSADVLHLLAGCWGPDWGESYSREEFRAVKAEFGLRAGAPRGGRSVYLSPGRAALAPEGLPGSYTPTATGGLLIDLTRGGTAQPSVGSIIETNRQLLAAGALEPLPVPFDRDRF
ncbi:Imm52 family immunity protein [Streptomyces sp. NPDC096323]|uniref:Imm52 family immunity protein n=1 Tax=Streptomyces sp. NPDC096323 TaxID=3155822 RepID=UPI0033330AD8